MGTVTPLPVYPSTQARKGFSASQLSSFHLNLSNAIEKVIALPPTKRDTPSTCAFISSYANDAAQQTLETLIWEDAGPAKHDDRLRRRVLLLAEKVVSSSPGLEPRMLLDLCISFPLKLTRLRSVLSLALSGTPDLPTTFTSEVVPAFTSLLSPSRSLGLYGLRKTARCLLSLLRPSPPTLVRPFAHSREFILAFARAYDDGLTAIARSYGGMRIGIPNRELDHWEKIWLETKVDMVDAFHVIMTTIVRDMSTASGVSVAVEADRTFDIVLALLDLVPQSTAVGSVDPVPFLDRPLVADYQCSYDLNGTLSSALSCASHDDARMKLLESTLCLLNVKPSNGNSKDPGALKLILRSSGVVIPGSSSRTVSTMKPSSNDRGKAKATVSEPTPPHDTDLDLQTTQVLDIFPDHSPQYIRKLLTHPSFPFRGNAERVIEALLEGAVPGEDALGESTTKEPHFSAAVPTEDAQIERRNVFDDEIMDLSRVHIGKKAQNQVPLTRDKAEVEQMKAEILRLAEAMSEESDEEDSRETRALDVMDLDDNVDEDRANTVKILGDGEDSGDDEVDEESAKPETILELAYIRDPKLFDRDAQTRRSKSRIDLKQQTGWTDEQIEGWKIMLERNPKKDRILLKHEFSGNRAVNMPMIGVTESQRGSSRQGDNRGRGRGRGQGRGWGQEGGRDGGERRELGETRDNVARDRAFKEKHKSSNRKRGHDRKVMKAGAGPSA